MNAFEVITYWFYIIFFAFLLLFIVFPIIFVELLLRFPRFRKYKDIEGLISMKITSPRKIQCWYTEKESKLAILIHGHTDNSGIIYERYADYFKNAGYDIFLMDLPNHGRSAYSGRVLLGIDEYKDVEGIITWIELKKKWDTLVLFGTSMGGISAILGVEAYLKNNPKASKIDIKGIILDSIFLNFQGVVNHNLERYFIIQPVRAFVIAYINYVRFRKTKFPNILKIMKKVSKIKILVLQGSEDGLDSTIIKKLNISKMKNTFAIEVSGGKHSRLFLKPEFKKNLEKFLKVL